MRGPRKWVTDEGLTGGDLLGGVLVCQRWRERRDTYRPAGEPIVTRHYEVAAVATDREARSFVERHHYSGSYPAARARFGLYRGGQLVGVAVLSQPASQAALRAALPLPIPMAARTELGRFLLLDDVPANGECARCCICCTKLGGVQGVPG